MTDETNPVTYWAWSVRFDGAWWKSTRPGTTAEGQR